MGIPRPKVTFGWDEYTNRGIAVARQMHQAIFRQMGIPEDTWQQPEPDVETAVIAGTTRMGASSKTSVVDPFCQSHDHPNLHIIGTGVYPTTGIVSPSMTAAGLALRAADQIHAGFGQG
jgi:choline dehydrogenase-like flavoprotein